VLGLSSARLRAEELPTEVLLQLDPSASPKRPPSLKKFSPITVHNQLIWPDFVWVRAGTSCSDAGVGSMAKAGSCWTLFPFKP